MQPALQIDSVSVRYGQTTALNGVTLHVPAGSITAILGPSGSGKSTLLSVCCGVVASTSGRVRLNGTDITDWPIEDRNIGVVFQGYALFPHLTVLENVTFALHTRRHRTSSDEARRRGLELLELVGLSETASRRPHQLSGGQQQRVALARALVFSPRALLLDEPLAALDSALRDQLQADIKRVRDRFGIPILYVTHDRLEAMNVADQLAVLQEGRLLQVGTPTEVYDRPSGTVAATLLGEANLLPAVIQSLDGDCLSASASGTRVVTPYCGRSAVGSNVIVMVRPSSVRLSAADDTSSTENRLIGTVTSVLFLGPTIRVSVRLPCGTEWRAYTDVRSPSAFTTGSEVALSWAISDTRILKDNGQIVEARSSSVAESRPAVSAVQSIEA